MEKKLTDKEIKDFFEGLRKQTKESQANFKKYFPNAEDIDNSEYIKVLKGEK